MTKFRVVWIGVFLAAATLPRWVSYAQLPLPSWFPPVWSQYLSAPPQEGAQPGQAPDTIPQYMESTNPTGRVATYQPAGATVTAGNAFFMSLGTNGRTCFTCHRPESAWGLTPAQATAIFNATQGRDPLFAPVDGMNCPEAAASATTLAQRRAASSQLLNKGNIRVALPVPANAEYEVRILRDPYGCNISSQYGLPAGMLNMYRRVLHSTNLTRNAQVDPNTGTVLQQGSIMWDEREPSLQSQFIDATLGHAQAEAPPSSDQVDQGVNFELGLFTAQAFSNQAGSLSAAGGRGGPRNLFLSGAPNVPLLSIPLAFHTYIAWGFPTNSAAQASINRGQTIFNTRTFTIVGVAGFNDVTGGGPATNSTCSTCHNLLNVGADVLPGGRHLGIGDNSSADRSGNQITATVLPPTTDQPLFSFLCPVGSVPFFNNPVVVDGQTYDEFQTTDPGVGLITGKCADLGKFKVPRLNGLAARAPYFHNGNAATLSKLIEFYNTRFSIGLSAQDKQDLLNFMNGL
jgi:cytochrome c peroxidase